MDQIMVTLDETKRKYVADIMISLEVDSSVPNCIDVVKRSVSDFIASYSSSDAKGAAPITDWRMKIVG